MAQPMSPSNRYRKLTLTPPPWHGSRIVNVRTGLRTLIAPKWHISGPKQQPKTTGGDKMRHKNSFELFDYWTSKLDGRSAPSRTDIEPADIRTLLPHVFICDLTADGQLNFRLAGTALCALHGRELKGISFASLWLSDGVRNAGRTGASVATGSTPAVLSLDCLSQGGRVVQAEMLLLPITGPSGQHDRLIGLVSIFDQPYWTGHDPIVGFSSTGIRFLDQTRDPLFLANRPEIKLPDSKKFAGAFTGNRKKVAHLVVLDGGRRD